jgi:hypothetical protein
MKNARMAASQATHRAQLNYRSETAVGKLKKGPLFPAALGKVGNSPN